MLLLAIEIDLDSFFDVNLVVFTTIAFLSSVVITTLLVFGLRPITARARIAKGLEPEKLNLTYLRLLIYGFAEFIAFVSDIFLVIFATKYVVPWGTIVVFLTITFYKLVFVLFKNFRDLGFNAKGLTDSLKTAGKVVTQRSFDPISEVLDKNNNENDNNEENMTKKVKYKRRNLRSKLPLVFIFLLLVSCISWRVSEKQRDNAIVQTTENKVVNSRVVYKSAFTSDNLVEKANKERRLTHKINRAKNIKSDKIVASEFTETKMVEENKMMSNEIPLSSVDTIIVKKGNKPLWRLIVTRTE